MAVVPMQKISLLIHSAEKAKVLAFLQKKGVLQITDIKNIENLKKLEAEEGGHDLEYRLAELDFAIKFFVEELVIRSQERINQQEILKRLKI